MIKDKKEMTEPIIAKVFCFFWLIMRPIIARIRAIVPIKKIDN